MGVLYIKKDRVRDWMKITRKNFMYLAREYGDVRPSYMSQLVNNATNIPGNFVGFLMHETNMGFDDLFYYDPNICKRNFYGTHVLFNGKMLKSHEYRSFVKDTLEEKIILDTAKI